MNKRNVIILAASFVGILVLILIILWILSIFGGKHLSYEQVEEKMVTATQAFYKSHPEILPTVDGKSTLAYNTLVENGYIEPLNKLLSDGDSCYAEVNVVKDGNNYSYIPKLSCSDKYMTRLLYEQILASNDVVESGSGLYIDPNGGYYFRGIVDNNYVSLGKTGTNKYNIAPIMWRIMGIDENNRIKMKATIVTDKTAFDTRFNVDKNTEIGYNTFENSEMKRFLQTIENDESFLKTEEKAKLSRSKLCIGKRSTSDPSNDGSTECSVLTEEYFMFGALLPYEFMRASVDPDCNSTLSRACKNLNFLIDEETMNSGWSLTATTDNSYEVYAFDGTEFDLSYAKNRKGIYAVVYLNEFTQYKSGDGTKANPYVLFKTK